MTTDIVLKRDHTGRILYPGAAMREGDYQQFVRYMTAWKYDILTRRRRNTKNKEKKP
ncbi:MAG: hypothetical protein IH840_00130 [Candidatus Heimdallarchaeota archaeon]|nr:hypothetical protein [Candidatus Heimdallarchaeota archaeon]